MQQRAGAEIEALGGRASAAGGDRGPGAGIERPAQRGREGGDRLVRSDERRLAVAHEGRVARPGRRHHGEPGEHRLAERERHPLPARRHDEDVRPAAEPGGVAAEPEERHALAELERRREGVQIRRVGSLARHEQAQARHVRERREGAQRQGLVLLMHEPSRQPERDLVFCEPELTADLGAVAHGRRYAVGDRDNALERDALVPRKHTACSRIEHDETPRPTVQDPAREPRERRALLVAVLREDDRGDPREEGRRTARVFPGREVRVNDRRAQPAQLAGEPDEEAEIAAPATADDDDREPEPGAFARRELVVVDRNDRHVRAGSPQLGAEPANLRLGAAALEPLHDVDDAQRARGRSGSADTSVERMCIVTQAGRFSCIVPFLNEAAHLPDVLATLAAQTVGSGRMYVIGIDDGSTDGSDALFEGWLARTGSAGVLVRSGRRSIPRALNRGLAEADGADIVVRLDAHTHYAPDYLATIEHAFHELPEDVWCVGGAPTPRVATDRYGFALGVALYSNPLGLGPADFRREPAAAVEVSTVYLGAWRPGVLQRLGGFNERWLANEDCELTERIRAAGGRIFRIGVRAERLPTRGPLATIQQWTRYGFWRMQTFKRYPSAVRPRHVVAPVALVGAIALLGSPWRRLLAPLYAVYALATIRCRRPGEQSAVTAGTLVFFPLVHVGYAAGLLVGLVRSPRGM